MNNKIRLEGGKAVPAENVRTGGQEARLRLLEDRALAGEKNSISSARISDLEYMARSGARFDAVEVDGIVRAEKETFMDTYGVDRLPYIVAGASGKHVYLVPIEGEKKGEVLKVYDAFNFYAVGSAVGHANEEIIETALERMQKGALASANLYAEPRAALCSYLFDEEWGLFTKLLPNYRIYMLNSGSESNDAALKLAVEYQAGRGKAEEKDTIIAMHNGYYGRTGYAINMSDIDFAIGGFPKIDKEIVFVKFGDSKELGRVFKEREGRILAVCFEPIQAEAGIIPAPSGFLKKMRELCDKEDAVMITDEVQTFARTGNWFASIALGATPDIIVTGKIISGATLPVTIIYAREDIKFGPNRHSNTYTGNPLGCEIAMKTLEIIERDGLLENSEKVGKYLLKKLRERLGSLPQVKAVRGRGCLIGIELADSVKEKGFEYAQKAVEEGLLISVVGGIGGANDVLRLLPSLAITKKEADFVVEALARTLG
ncbi:MAG: aspartate aminotransferase family protein [Candidatus Burarchaeum sp.]|nr:aspartate aminotransferase family protein [Candidatus Burarchaeum sp.]MDO8340013.1 aspartate aminotransferase family protein [Candidatus Burarchaeum sp.]